MIWSWIWKLGFWGNIFILLVSLSLEFLDIEYDKNIEGFPKWIILFTFLSMWSYAIHKAYKAKGVLKKLWLFILAVVFNMLAGLVMFFYDNYAANSDIKNH